MPNPACVEPKCGGLIIRVGVHEHDHRKALQLARKVVRRNLHGKWKVAPLGQRVRDFAVTRVGKRGAIGVGTAWDNVYRLANDRDVVDVEPTFDIAGLEPDLEHMARQLTSWEQVSAKSSGGGSRDKRCSTAYDWSIENCRFVKAWNVPPVGGKRFGKGIKVGHPDTGYTHHPEIWNNPLGEQRVQSGYDFVDADPSAYDPLARGNPGHGTKTGSLIMSNIGFHLGAPFITGGAPEAVLVAYRVMKSVVVVRFKNVVEAIYEAVDDGCHVISMSLGGPVAGWALPRAVRYAVDRGVILFAAAGNYWPWVVYPAKHDEVIAVTASNCQDKPWSSTARGKSVDIAAPGESVWTATTTEENSGREYSWTRGNGTSFAAPIAAAVCALWLAHHGRTKLIQTYGKENLASVFKEVLVTAGVRTPTGWKTDKYGSGILDARKLLEAKLPKTPSAKGMKIFPMGGAAPTDTVMELCEYFPRRGVAAVRAALAKELRVKEINLDDFLAQFGHEVTFHVATNTAFRQSVQNRLKGLKVKSAEKNKQLGSQASRTLKRALRI